MSVVDTRSVASAMPVRIIVGSLLVGFIARFVARRGPGDRADRVEPRVPEQLVPLVVDDVLRQGHGPGGLQQGEDPPADLGGTGRVPHGDPALGLAFSAFLDVWEWYAFFPHTGAAFTLQMSRGFPFDLAHAIGNVVISVAIGPELRRVLERYERRTRVEIAWA